MKLEYYINEDACDAFRADVRLPSGEKIFEINAGDILDYDEVCEVFADGHMKNKYDLDGLLKYLKDLGIAEEQDILVRGN